MLNHSIATPGERNLIPIALDIDFTMKPSSGNIIACESASFTATTVSGSPVDTWEWDFDNDRSVDSTDANPTWDFGNSAGTYTVTLTGISASGSDTETGIVTVQPNGLPFWIGGTIGVVAILIAGSAFTYCLARMGARR